MKTRTPSRTLPAALAVSVALASLPASAALLAPSVTTVDLEATGDVCVIAKVPPGFRHVVLERYNVATGSWENVISGSLNGASNEVTMIDSTAGVRNIYRVTAGESIEVPAAPLTGEPHVTSVYDGSSTPITGDAMIGHALNRVAYGPTAEDYAAIQLDGVVSYINKQLDPASIDESGNTDLNDSVEELFYTFVPGTGTTFLGEGSPAVYLKGDAAPPNDWMSLNFDDSAWAATTSPVGYGPDLDFADPLEDMRADGSAVPPVPGYYTFYMRQQFTVADPSSLQNFFLDIQYDDSFIAYLNGTEIARANISGTPAFNTPADSTSGTFDQNVESAFDIASFTGLLNPAPGVNVLAVEVHNASLTSSDAGALPVLIDYPDSPYQAIKGSRELQHLIHLRGIYADRQLQAVLAEFWENHFTTDFDKVQDFLEDLDEYRAFANMSEFAEDQIQLQAEMEAARIEWEEYEFFHDNALGYFGDLLLFSATSPSMLIYLDNVLNTAANPNENYGREILELSAFGVDNGYTQTDIEELSKCFTGWTVRKVPVAQKKAFPTSARDPFITDSVSVASETPVLDLGPGWKYFKGTAEPPSDWAQPGFPAAGWLDGSTGIGYGDGDDETILDDMSGNYISVYVRGDFQLDFSGADAPVLEVDYDDGFVAYLNGFEIGRRGLNGEPPAFDTQSSSHGAAVDGGEPAIIDLNQWLGIINAPPATNTLAFQVHNTSLGSSDLTLRPRVLSRTYSADSIPVVDAGGLWTFRFNPDDHNLEAKTIFPGLPWQVDLPANRTGVAGVNDAIEVIDAMVAAPPCAEFISIKLVNRFVSDEISLDTYQDRSAPAHLLETMDNAVTAWFSTSPPGHIGTVMRAVLDLEDLTGSFWQESAMRQKVKNPIEYVNSAYRALGAKVDDQRLANRTEDMGMELFTRDEPDGFDEKGVSWTDTQSLLERMKFSQGLASNRGYSYGDWDIPAFLTAYGLDTGEKILDHFHDVLFQRTLPAERLDVFREFMDTNELGDPSPFDSLSGNARINRVEALLGLILSTPEFQLQ